MVAGVAYSSFAFKPLWHPPLVRNASFAIQNTIPSGTQCIDSTWRALDQAIPSTLHTKKDHTLNPLLEEYTWCWLYRINHRMVDGFACLGAFVRAMD